MLTQNINSLPLISWPINNIWAASSSRHSPDLTVKSNKPYHDFNLGLHVGDCEKSVQRNRQLLASHLPINTDIQWFEQVHGCHVHVVKQLEKTAIIADAAYTQDKKIALAIMDADCLPILISSLDGKEIAAIHGGWRPLAKGIIEKTIKHFDNNVENLSVWLGPCIGKNAFEVGQNVVDCFVSKSNEYQTAFTAINSLHNKYLADLPLIATIELNKLGIKNIIQASVCTVTNEDDYFSYRRDGVTGRMASLICRT